MDAVVVTYGVYLAISLLLTVWVAQTLFRNGRIFLVDIFRGNQSLADSVNHLLVVGFYLINLGFIVRGLRIYGMVADVRQGVEAVADKIGVVLLILGFMHFFNLYVFSRIRRRTTEFDSTPVMPPVSPDFTTRLASSGAAR
jgi:hypothetical protein